MRAWIPSMVVLAACSFGSPEVDDPGGDGDGDGDGGGSGGGNNTPDAQPACLDDDGDTVCNTADKCQGHDDRSDVDGDGAPNGCDDWPCGLKPGDPGSFMDDEGSEGRQWYATFINIGDARRAVATPGGSLSVQLRWGLFIDCGGSLSSCRGQVELGYGATRLRCLYDNNVADEQLLTTNYSGQIAMPMTPGVYEIRLNAGRAAMCGNGSAWYGGDPGPESTIAIVCVR